MNMTELRDNKSPEKLGTKKRSTIREYGQK
jgi:hypothetical protein